MTVDEFMEAVIYPATNSNGDVDSVDPVFGSSGTAFEVGMTDGSTFLLTVAALTEGTDNA